MSSLAPRAPPSSTIHNTPSPRQRPTGQDEPRPTIIGPDDGPEPPFPVKLYGKVEHGFKRGSRELGCPTANLPATLTNNPALERNGVYFGWASVWITSPNPLPPVIKPMVMSVGYNPVYGNKSRTIEVHVIHTFDQDFYGETVKVIVTGFIRPEYNYSSKEALIQDIEIDKTAALQSLKRPDYQAFSEDEFLLKN
ncbi:riboflavin kinase [Puccinia graminis f. sp. tritici]|uniref:Riboflavin kinase n=1 Tax=Puccinia graminis f. sp. tritici TaxID=56615 RepID=A0A5B0LLT5_PUCGR|nr:riboflavin kinase [Puccinia graminis f. sp. tritici]KAA1128499.1 riboflavin kinase [Puccinia graminis f. sp. tritici]